jgi:hypothetical protein
VTGRAAAALASGLVALAGAVLAACHEGTPAKPPPAEPPLAVVPTTFPSSTAGTAPGRRANVPPSVLSRAAEARALDRAPACPPPPKTAAPAPPPPPVCTPDPHVTVEIEWDGTQGD